MMKKIYLNNLAIFISIFLILVGCMHSHYKKEVTYKPNIIWIVVEDMSENWSCYGETTIQTPNIDKLAGEGELFTNAFVTASVCSPCRSALITGMYQTTIGAHNHRSQRDSTTNEGNPGYYSSYRLPEEVPYLPRLFKEAGYFTVLGDHQSVAGKQSEKLGKTDYNFIYDPSWYDSNDWNMRKPGQPFFAQIQLRGGKYRDAMVDNPVDPEKVILPPYYPADEVTKKDWAEYLNSVLYLDKEVKQIVERLERERILDSTVIFLFTDHGVSHLRGKQFLYDEGMKIPMIVKWSGRIPEGVRRNDLVTQTDISATSLFLAGIPIPEQMQGKPFYGEDYQPAEYVFSARNRCDETFDLIRAVRTERFKYIRNYMSDKPHAQPNKYKNSKEVISHIRQMYAEGRLMKETARYFEPGRPTEELYDLENDPWELNNLAGDKACQDTLIKIQDMLLSTIYNTNDMGFIPEPIAEDLGKKYGNKFFILQQEENRKLTRQCIETIELCERGDVHGLERAIKHESASVRFWAAYGLGNIAEPAEETMSLLRNALYAENDAVKIAAARAICRLEKDEEGLKVLVDNLENKNLIVGLYSALFIEDLDGEMIRKIQPAIEKAKMNPYGFTRRVAERLSDRLTANH